VEAVKKRRSWILYVLVFLWIFSVPAPGRSAEGSAKPPLVMIHGMFVGPWCWDRYGAYFSERGYRVLTPLLRHHDTTLNDPPPAGLRETGIHDYVADVEKEIASLPQKPVLIGHSMGGLIAQIIAAKGKARAVVLISPAAPWGINAASRTVIKSAWLNRRSLFAWGEPLRPTFEGAVYSSLHLLPPEERRRVFARFTYESPRAATQIGLWFLDPKRSTAVEARRVSCPVLTVVGAEDRLTVPSAVRKIHERYPGRSTYVELPRHGHFIIAEPGWEEGAQIIESWLKTLPP